MSAAEILAEIQALSSEECAVLVESALPHLTVAQLKQVDRKLRRLAHPDVPDEIWEGMEDAEDGRLVEMELALRETPPTHVMNRSESNPRRSQ